MPKQAVLVQVQRAPGTDSYIGPPLLRVQKKLIAENELREHLKKELARRGDCSNDCLVFIYGDRELPFLAVVKVVDVINELGGTPVLVGSAEMK